MPQKRFRPDHLELRHKTYFALLTVPKDVQFILGKKRFFKTTGTSDLRVAQAKAELFVIQWKSEIASARQRSDDPIINSALELNRIFKSSPKHLVSDVIDQETERLRFESSDLVAETFNSLATGKSKTLDSFMAEWKRHQLKCGLQEKTVNQMESDLAHLTSFMPTTNLITSQHCDLWIKNLAVSNALTAYSVVRIISGCRNFFKYLQEIEVFPDEMENPFRVPAAHRISKKRNAKTINKRDSWLPLTEAELGKVYVAAIEKKDSSLTDLILIAAYTGARIEELCSLKKEFVNLTDYTIQIEDSKTEAGNRIVPIHTHIRKTIKKLMVGSGNEFLFDSLTKNKYGDRSNAIGKRFGRIKSDLGFGSQKVFHSIRKTFTTALEQASVAESITADIVGHEKQTMTYGLYSGGSSLEQKRKAIAKIKFPI
jgi:integrase